ncbi:hypothetical protein EDD85DRAFT_866892 [Armillaria nabsnona]|nr:hypothetical protein EDD85DRAFT_866892 [Armillaria nabsnona]
MVVRELRTRSVLSSFLGFFFFTACLSFSDCPAQRHVSIVVKHSLDLSLMSITTSRIVAAIRSISLLQDSQPTL